MFWDSKPVIEVGDEAMVGPVVIEIERAVGRRGQRLVDKGLIERIVTRVGVVGVVAAVVVVVVVVLLVSVSVVIDVISTEKESVVMSGCRSKGKKRN